jgi:hypothetical protein
MNIREGMRRLGLVAGVLGASAGAVVAYTQLQPILAQRTQHKAFRSLVTSVVVQKELEFLKRESVSHRLPPGAKPLMPGPDEHVVNPAPPGEQQIEFNGVIHLFPPDATDTEIQEALSTKATPVDLSSLSGEQLSIYRDLLKKKHERQGTQVYRLHNDRGVDEVTTEGPRRQNVFEQATALNGSAEGWKVNDGGVRAIHFSPSTDEKVHSRWAGEISAADISDIEANDGHKAY